MLAVFKPATQKYNSKHTDISSAGDVILAVFKPAIQKYNSEHTDISTAGDVIRAVFKPATQKLNDVLLPLFTLPLCQNQQLIGPSRAGPGGGGRGGGVGVCVERRFSRNPLPVFPAEGHHE